MNKQSYIYILSNKPYGTLYIGITDNLIKRVWQHKTKFIKSFTQKYDVHLLVYYEVYEDINEAILREKRLKKWKRVWKIRLIEGINPKWEDLYNKLIG